MGLNCSKNYDEESKNNEKKEKQKYHGPGEIKNYFDQNETKLDENFFKNISNLEEEILNKIYNLETINTLSEAYKV